MIEVMLAVAAKVPAPDAMAQLQVSGHWWFELKYDGIRALITATGSGKSRVISIHNRRGRDITFRYPEVAAAWRGREFTGVLDGEIVCLDEQANPVFEWVHRRDAQQSASAGLRESLRHPAEFIAFDVLFAGDLDLRSLTYLQRRARLGVLGVVSFASQDPEAMWAFVQERGLEGLIAKLDSSTYRAGRQPAWVKLKNVRRAFVLVGGYTPGKGSRADVGALVMQMWDGGQLVDVGHVGSGLRDGDARRIVADLAGGRVIVIEVEYLELSRSGKLRMPVFKRLAPEIDAASVLVSSLR